MKNLSLIVVAVITLVFASCSKPVNNNPNTPVVETKTDLITSGTWKTFDDLGAGEYIDDKITFYKNSKGVRTMKKVFGGVTEVHESTFTWSFTNNQQNLELIQSLVKLNGNSVSAVDGAPELRKFKLDGLSSSNLVLRQFFVDGVTLSQYPTTYTH